jgi:uncharacterized repeat protein (TIGR01451 family)
MQRIYLLLALLLLMVTLPLSAQDNSATPIEFTGTVESVDGTVVVVAGLPVDVSGLDPATSSQIVVGMNVSVTGTLNGTTVMATALGLPEVTTQTTATDVQVTADGIAEPNYTITYNGMSSDATQTTFTYTVTGMGVPTALSHFDLEIPTCPTVLELSAYSPTDAVELGVDPTTGVNGIKWDLPLGETESRTYSFSFLGQVAEGEVTAAVKNGDGYFTVTVPGPSCAQPSVDIEKFVSADNGTTWSDVDEAPGVEMQNGAQVFFRLVVTNDGNVPLTGLVLSDTVVATTSCVVPPTLEVDASFECMLGATATEVQHTNTAIINAQYENYVVGDADLGHYFTGSYPAINVEKYVSIGGNASWVDADSAPGSDAQEGDTVYFRFVVTNNGNVPLTNVVLSDNSLNTSSCAIPATLEPDASAECVVGPLTATANQHTNIATVTANGNGTPVTDSDAANYFGRTEPVVSGCFTIVFVGSVYANGQTTFNYAVIGINGCSPDLSHFDIEIPTCPIPLRVVVYNPTDAVSFGIDPTTHINGIKWDLPMRSNLSRNYSITFEGNVAIGSVVAAVKDGDGFHPVSVPGPACDVAQLVVEKSVSVDGGTTWIDADAAPGPDAELTGQVSFRFRVMNEGNSLISGITLTDNILNLSSCTIQPTLAAGAFFECIAGPFPVAQGQHSNTATVRGTFANGTVTTVDTDAAHYFGGDRPEIDVEGYASKNNGASWVDADAAPGLSVAIGDSVAFRYVVTNTGNVALSGMTLSGNLGNISACSIPATLEPAASFECLAGSIVAVAGQQTDTVNASGTAAGTTVNASDPTNIFAGELPGNVIVDEDGVIVVIEGPVDGINGNIITIYGVDFELDPNDPRLTVLQIGDILRIEGIDDGTILIIILIDFTNIEVFIQDGIIWRDGGNCSNPPPSWAPALGWRGRCETGGGGVIVTGGGGLPPGCKYTGFGNNNIRIKCSGGGSGRGSGGSR